MYIITYVKQVRSGPNQIKATLIHMVHITLYTIITAHAAASKQNIAAIT